MAKRKNIKNENFITNPEDFEDDFFSSFISDDDNSYEAEMINKMIELEEELYEITGNGISKESEKIEKLNQKMEKLMLFDFDKKSEKMLQKFTVEIDDLIIEYIKLTEGIENRCEKLSEFMNTLNFENPIIEELSGQASTFLFMCSGFENQCRNYILQLAHKKQNLKIFNLEERIKKLETLINKK